MDMVVCVPVSVCKCLCVGGCPCLGVSVYCLCVCIVQCRWVSVSDLCLCRCVCPEQKGDTREKIAVRWYKVQLTLRENAVKASPPPSPPKNKTNGKGS